MEGPIQIEVVMRFVRLRRKWLGFFGQGTWRIDLVVLAPNGEPLRTWYGQEFTDQQLERIEITSNVWRDLLMQVGGK